MKKLTSLLLAIGVFCATAMTASAQAPLQYRVDDIADLLAITLYGSDAKVVAWVGGNTTRDDGLGGMFYYDGTSSAATNVYAVFKPTNNNGRWFKLPTSVAWQNAAVTVGDESTYGWRFMRGTGQTNFFGIGADNNNVYLQSWSSKNLHINNVGNSTILNASANSRVGVGDTHETGKFSVNGAYQGTTESYQIKTAGTLTGNPNERIGLARFGGTLAEAGSGTHDLLTGIGVYAPTVTGAAGAVSDTASLYISGAMSATVSGANYALWSDAGDNRFDGNIINNALTASLPVFTDANKVLVSQSVAATKTALGIQTGSGTTATDGTVTNTFATAFSSAPKVFVQQTGAAISSITNSVISVTTTNFVLDFDTASITFDYIAIGAP